MESSTQPPGPRIDVPQVLDEKQVLSFVEKGYLVVPELLAAAELEELKRDLVAVARGEYGGDSGEATPRNFFSP